LRDKDKKDTGELRKRLESYENRQGHIKFSRKANLTFLQIYNKNISKLTTG
jgi:hypothetical protein